MLRFQIQDWVWGVLFGILVTIVAVGATLKYLPSPRELFGDETAECRQSAIHTQKEAEHGEEGAKAHAAILQNTNSDNLKNNPDDNKNEYDCLIANYTGNLAAFTRGLVAVTFLLACFGFWQIMVSRSTAKRQLRAYVFVHNGEVRLANIGASQTSGYKLSIELKNFGCTPARGYPIWVDNVIRNIDELPFTDSPKIGKQSPPTIIWPTASATIDFATPFEDGELEAIRVATKAIFIWGQCSYMDVFKKPCYFKFKFKISGHENQGLWRLRPHEIGEDGN